MAEKAQESGTPTIPISRGILNILDELGEMALFLFEAFILIFAGWGQLPKTIRQIYFIGVQSIAVIGLIGLFTGMVMGMQLYYALSVFGADGFLGTGLALSMVRELAPVLTAIMLTGRAGSAMTAEIGVMRISEQIDALSIMDINPMRYLVAPKLGACLLSFPILTALFNLIALWGGWLTGVKLLGANEGVYWARVNSALDWADIQGGFIKAMVFGVLVCVICCFEGYWTHTRSGHAGPEGVSQSTTNAVVKSCVITLAADYILTSLLW
ncbi:MlaE family ABC transporter permease [Pseudodesulfovibrio piezophilus]|uniref:Putative ABC transporter permease protein HI_1086 n=1 Tax=Pseudodesulfovibrio piezophilus (strain DSM 21447 / JCM 15486 / C1TLV30) TaxID=1322246 RepID=M1WM46_PSEP2|nr:ABC transporter permease [Pseudodesulfovibrio piezophilus]CCH48970.1 putative ABC transporter permease protein HI_1086 [Pseudodesulfovibrio piezophilus C1TLV30]